MNKTTSIKTTARIAGLLYLLQIPLGVFGIIYIPNLLLQSESIEEITGAILSHEFLFRLSTVSTILCALCTVVTAVYIRKVLRVVHASFAKWIVVFTLIVLPISLLNELNHIAVLVLVRGQQLDPVYTSDQLHNLVTLFLDLHQYGLQLIGIFFGLWVLPMGYLVIKSGYIPKLIGYLLVLTCIGYLADFVIFFLLPNSGIVVSEFTWLGEVLMVLWLLIKGVNLEKYEKMVAAKHQIL